MPKDQQTPRTSQTIQAENMQLQLRAGAIQYFIAQHTKELSLVNDQMRDMAIEYAQVKTQEDKEAGIRAEIEAKVKKEAEDAKPKLAVVEAQKPTSEAQQATTQSGSEAAPTPSQDSPDEQGQKKE